MEERANAWTDEEMIERVIRGDTNSFKFLLDRYQEFVFRLLRRHIPLGETEEVAQEVFIRVYCSLGNFAGKSSFQQWLSAIAIRTCYDFWRKEYRKREVTASSLPENSREMLEEVMASEADNFHFEERADWKELLESVLARLSPEDRMVFELIYLQEFSGQEAARLLGWNIANVKIRSFRLRKKLCRILSDLLDSGK